MYGNDSFSYSSQDHDTFVFASVSDADWDVIGFFHSGLDHIDLSGIDADRITSKNEAFNFIGDAAFNATDATGQLRFEDVVLYGSTDADAQHEFTIFVTGVPELVATDFML